MTDAAQGLPDGLPPEFAIVDCAVVSVLEVSSSDTGTLRLRSSKALTKTDLKQAAQALIDARGFTGEVIVRGLAGMTEATSQELYDSLEGNRCTPAEAQTLCNILDKDGKGKSRNIRAEEEMRNRQGPGWRN